MKRSRLLTIPRAVARKLIATLLLTMTAQTAWATDLTSANATPFSLWEYG